MACGKCADQLAGIVEPMSPQVVFEAGIDGFANQRIVKQRRADPDGSGARQHELDGIGGRRNAALANDWHIVCLRHLVNLVHLQQCNWLDRRGRTARLACYR